MISPIQLSVPFKGVEKNQSSDKFTGAMQTAKSVRSDYSNAVQEVTNKQMQIQETVGNSLNIIA